MTNKTSWRSKVTTSLVSILLGVCLGTQLNLLSSLFHIDFEGRGDDFLDGRAPPPLVEQELQQEENTNHYDSSRSSSGTDEKPSYLNWADSPPKIPANWSYVTPDFCAPTKRCDSCYEKWRNHPVDFSKKNVTEKIIVHYHMQHNAGTNFFSLAHNFTPCATRACWQREKHCLVSYDQEVEAENIRSNYERHGIQYVSYEVMLPPRFPLPFVSESAREGLFFTTIMRNPMDRFTTWIRGLGKNKFSDGSPHNFFWSEMVGNRGLYKRENLNVRWLAGALDEITSDHLNIAKCRLQLFDLVIVDTYYDTAVNEVVCPLNNWEGTRYCNATLKSDKDRPKKKDPLSGTDSHFVGAWIERLRPSFELYDYARILSYAHLQMNGVKDVPKVSSVPSYIQALSKYTNITLKVPEKMRVSAGNIDKMHPPEEFCEKMKRIWRSNSDEVPFIYGIGALGNGVWWQA